MKKLALLFAFVSIAAITVAQNDVWVRNGTPYPLCVAMYGNTICSATGMSTAGVVNIPSGASVLFPFTAIRPFQGLARIVNQSCAFACTPATSTAIGPWAGTFGTTFLVCGTTYVATATWNGSTTCTDAVVTIL